MQKGPTKSIVSVFQSSILLSVVSNEFLYDESLYNSKSESKPVLHIFHVMLQCLK